MTAVGTVSSTDFTTISQQLPKGDFSSEAFGQFSKQLYQMAYDLKVEAVDERLSPLKIQTLTEDLLGCILKHNVGYEALVELIENYYSNSMLEEFKDALEGVLNSGSIKALKSKASLLLSMLEDDFKVGCELLDQAIKFDHKNFTARGLKVKICDLYSQDSADDRAHDVPPSFKEHPTDSRFIHTNAPYNLAQYTLFHDVDDDNIQMHWLSKQLEVFPANPDVLFKRATVHFNQGSLRNALVDLKFALEIEPEHEEALELRAKVCIEISDRGLTPINDLDGRVAVSEYLELARSSLAILLDLAKQRDPYSYDTVRLYEMEAQLAELSAQSPIKSYEAIFEILEDKYIMSIKKPELHSSIRFSLLVDVSRRLVRALLADKTKGKLGQNRALAFSYIEKLVATKGEVSNPTFGKYAKEISFLAADAYRHIDKQISDKFHKLGSQSPFYPTES